MILVISPYTQCHWRTRSSKLCQVTFVEVFSYETHELQDRHWTLGFVFWYSILFVSCHENNLTQFCNEAEVLLNDIELSVSESFTMYLFTIGQGSACDSFHLIRSHQVWSYYAGTFIWKHLSIITLPVIGHTHTT